MPTRMTIVKQGCTLKGGILVDVVAVAGAVPCGIVDQRLITSFGQSYCGPARYLIVSLWTCTSTSLAQLHCCHEKPVFNVVTLYDIDQ